MFKFKVMLLAATVAGGFALTGAASAAPLSTSPIAAPTNIEQTAQQGRRSARRSAHRSRQVNRHRGYRQDYYGNNYGYGYGSPYAYQPAAGLWVGAPSFGVGIGF